MNIPHRLTPEQEAYRKNLFANRPKKERQALENCKQKRILGYALSTYRDKRLLESFEHNYRNYKNSHSYRILKTTLTEVQAVPDNIAEGVIWRVFYTGFMKGNDALLFHLSQTK